MYSNVQYTLPRVRPQQVVTGKSTSRSLVRDMGTLVHSLSRKQRTSQRLARSHGCRPPFSARIKRSCCMCSQTATECLHPWLQCCGAATWMIYAAGTVRFCPEYGIVWDSVGVVSCVGLFVNWNIHGCWFSCAFELQRNETSTG